MTFEQLKESVEDRVKTLTQAYEAETDRLARHAESSQGGMKLLRRIWRRIFPPQCHCRIMNEWPHTRSTVRECPVHGDDVLYL